MHLYLLQVKFTTKFSSKVFRLLPSGITAYLNIARQKSYYSISLRLEIQKSSQFMQARKLVIFSSKAIQPEKNYAIFNTLWSKLFLASFNPIKNISILLRFPLQLMLLSYIFMQPNISFM